MLMALCQSDKGGWVEVKDLTGLSDLRAKDNTLLWAEADVRTLKPEEIALVAEEFGLHELAVEDAVHTRQRPKIDRYESHVFVVMHELVEHEGQLEAVQIACFVGPGYVVSLHAGAQRTVEAAKKRWADAEPEEHPSYLLHTLMDVVVDDYQRITDRVEEEMEVLEEVALANPGQDIQKDLYSVKQRLARLRRYVIPGARYLEWTRTGESREPFSAATVHLFRDVHDHLLRITDQIHNVEELTNAVLDLTRNAQAARLNENSRKLSAWAAIFAVMTVIGGIYGMNFELVPDEGSIQGFWFALGLMTVLGLGLFGYFKKRGWL